MNLDIWEILKIIPAAVIGLTVHEFAHAYTAYQLGDDTAKLEGRITLNPLKHIDWLGFFLIVVAGFGWAKPVTFNPDNLKKKHRDEILISIAGPLSNLLLVILFFGIARLLYGMNISNSGVAYLMIRWGIINISLFIFNLIPLPPLDGSHLYLTYLKDIHPKLMMKLYTYGTLGLFVIIMIENKTDVNILHISEAVQFVTGFIIRLLGF
jgi:Zn-dependent protease